MSISISISVAHPPPNGPTAKWKRSPRIQKSKVPRTISQETLDFWIFGLLDFVLCYACLCFLCFFVLFLYFLYFFALFALFCTFCTFFALLAHFCTFCTFLHFLHFFALLSNFTTFLQIFVLLNVLFQSKSPKIQKSKNPKTQKSKNPKFSGQSPRKLWIFGFLDFWILKTFHIRGSPFFDL